jgi:ABC-type Mn2+/Zn2+ transport system permease subunit
MKQTAVEWWKLLIVFVSAIVLEANSIAGLRFLIDKNWIGMVIMVGINPFLCLPMNHYTIEVKTLKQRALIALAFSLGFAVGVITIRPFFI